MGPQSGFDVPGWVVLDQGADSHIGMNEDSREEFDAAANERVRIHKGFRQIMIEMHVYAFDSSAADLMLDLEIGLRGEEVLFRLLNPSDEQPAISMLEFNPLQQLPYDTDQHQGSHALLEVPCLYGYERRDKSATPDYIETATAEGEPTL